MAAIPLKQEIHYPESDGRPMGETEVHSREIMELILALRQRYLNAADVYTHGDLLLYYVEGKPGLRVCPDVFVAFGVPKEPLRRSYFLWKEGHPPSFVIEVTSEGTRREDLNDKKEIYARIGVEEYFLFDPLGEYLRPPLQGFRLVDGEYHPIQFTMDGSLVSQTTGLILRREAGSRLRLVDLKTGEPLLRSTEAHAAREIAEERARTAEARLQEETAARRAVEEELARLRRELERRG